MTMSLSNVPIKSKMKDLLHDEEMKCDQLFKF
jgi:hypothetical protein